MNTALSKYDNGSGGATCTGALRFTNGNKLQQVVAMRILLADDHGMVRDTMSAYLETEGRAVVEAVENYHEAMKMLSNKGPFDLVLLDFSMPGMNGLEGLSDAIKAYPDQPVRHAQWDGAQSHRAGSGGTRGNRLSAQIHDRKVIGQRCSLYDCRRNLCASLCFGGYR